MKSTATAIFFAVIILGGASAYAGSASLPYTFQSGTPARAAEVNGNFTAVKSAVDDNDIRLSGVEAGVQNKVSKDGDAMTGTLTVPAIVYSSPKTKRELLAMDDFACRDPYTNCPARNYNGQWISSTAGQTLTLSARLHMPDGAALSDVWCLFNDNSASDASFRILIRDINFGGIGWSGVMTGSVSTSGATTTVQTLQASTAAAAAWTPANLTADNTYKAFFVEVTVPYDGGFTASFNGNNLALLGCYYDYTVTEP